MASCDWQKIKTAQEAKAMFRHCVTDERMKSEHANTEIDKSRTRQNVAYGLMSDYVESCEKYDARLAELDAVQGANKRKDRVTLVGLSIPTPEGMPEDVAHQWFADVYAHIEERFGSENVIGGTAHFDEVHEYKDAETGKQRESRAHLHAYVVPVAGDRLNAKQVMSRANMISLNREVEELTHERYPEYRFMTGTKRKSKKSVEELKNASAEREAEQIVAQAHAEAERIVRDAQIDAQIDARMNAELSLIDAQLEADEILSDAQIDAQVSSESILSNVKTKAKQILAEADKTRSEASESLRTAIVAKRVYEQASEATQNHLDSMKDERSLEDWAQGKTLKSGKTIYDLYLSDTDAENKRKNRAFNVAQQHNERVKMLESKFGDMLNQHDESNDMERG